MKMNKQALQEEWAGEDQKIRTLLGDEEEDRGYLGATIGGRLLVPYQPSGTVPELDVDFARLSPVSSLVREGKFHGDEWIHDPALRGWVWASDPSLLAVRCADHLAAAGPEGWFVSTDQRIGVAVDASVVVQSGASSETKEPDRQRGGVGGFLGKARSALGAVAEISEGLWNSGSRCAVIWECSREHVTRYEFVKRGRATIPHRFLRVEVTDGSALELRLNLHGL